MIDWRKQTKKKKTPSIWDWCQVAEAVFVVCRGVAKPSCLPTADTELPEQRCLGYTSSLVMCAGGQSSIPRFIFICFLKFHSGEACIAGFSSRKSRDSRCEQRDGAGYVQELAQSLLTFLTCRYCDSRCDVVLQGMISGELQVVWKACPYTMIFLPVSSQNNNA